MDQIGFIGLGKLGLPIASTMSVILNSKINVYDSNDLVKDYILNKKVPYLENRIEEFLPAADLSIKNNIEDLVLNSSKIFIAVQTPHDKNFEGITPLPQNRVDFDYSYLINVITEIKESFIKNNLTKDLEVIIISTVLPGTLSEKILPIVSSIDNIKIFYNPYFIAMGRTIDDFLNPEFIIIGSKNKMRSEFLNSIYRKIVPNAKIFHKTYEEAEMIKVLYNTFIGLKIIFANTIAEISESLGANSDDVIEVLSQANDRLISNKYLSPGMGDGGGCHPRDQIAMSYLAKKLNLSFDLFEMIAKARDQQTKRHAYIIKEKSVKTNLPVIILGKAYKKNVNLTVGSPSYLLQYFLNELGVKYKVFDPLVDNSDSLNIEGPHVIYVATPHDIFKNMYIPSGSYIIDPWGDSIEQQYSIRIVNLGRYSFG